MIERDTEVRTTARQNTETGRGESDRARDRVKKGQVYEIRKRLKVSYKRSSLFQFLFSEYKKIRSFGANTRILYPKLFPPGIELNRYIHLSFARYLQPLSIELFKALTYMLKKKWSQLEKIEYNLFVMFRRLCEQIALTNFNLLNYDNADLIDRLIAIETYFLTIHADPGYPEKIVTAMSRLLTHDMQYKSQVQELSASANKILGRNLETPSLYNFLIGLNMLKFRRYVDLKDLIAPHSDEIVRGDLFRAEKDIQQEIDDFIVACKKNITFLARKKNDILRIKTNLPVDDNGEIDFSMLKYLYETYESHDLYKFLEDQSDVILFTSRLLRLFRGYFQKLLCGSIELFGIGHKSLFPQGFFALEFGKIDTLISQLDELSYDYTSPVNLEHYLAMKGTENASSKSDAEIPMIVDDVLVLFYNLGKRIAQIVRDCPDCSDDSDRDLDQDLLTVPIDTRVSGGRTGFNGRSVEEALLFVVNTCFLIDYLFHGRFTYTLISKESMIDDEINTKLQVLKRVADESVYREIASLCCESDEVESSAG